MENSIEDDNRLTNDDAIKMENSIEDDNRLTNDDAFYLDFSLRPPLPPITCGNCKTDGMKLNSTCDNDDCGISFLLYRMYVACHVLRLGIETRFTALVLLHRYYFATKTEQAQTSTKTVTSSWNDCEASEWKWIAAACLFLACKTEEEPRRLRDVINLAHMVLTCTNEDYEQQQQLHNEKLKRGKVMVESTVAFDVAKCHEPPFKTEEKTRATISSAAEYKLQTDRIVLNMKSNPPPLNDDYWDAKAKIVSIEQNVLRWLGFDVSVTHPHRAVLLVLNEQQKQQEQEDNRIIGYSQQENKGSSNSDIKNSSNETSEYNDIVFVMTCKQKDAIACVAFRRLNDALFHAPALQHPVLCLACAAIQLALEEVVALSKPAATHLFISTAVESNATSTSAARAFSTNSILNNNTAVCNFDSSSSSTQIRKTQFKRSWWRRYSVSDENMIRTKTDLSLATRSLLFYM